jgi:hypothetical protein
MNELEFKHHLKDLVHGHHHPEEHNWNRQTAKPTSAGSGKVDRPKRRVGRKASKHK